MSQILHCGVSMRVDFSQETGCTNCRLALRESRLQSRLHVPFSFEPAEALTVDSQPSLLTTVTAVPLCELPLIESGYFGLQVEAPNTSKAFDCSTMNYGISAQVLHPQAD